MSYAYDDFINHMEYVDIIAKFSYYDSVECYQGKDYLFITPKQQGDYIPYMLHTQIVDGNYESNIGVAVINDILTHNHEQPPFILITEGKFGLKNFMNDGVFNQYTSLVNIIFTINGNKAYTYEYADNLPQEIIDVMHPWYSRKAFSSAGLRNQTLSCMYDIPGVTIHPNMLNMWQYTDKLFNEAVCAVTSIMNNDFTSFADYVHTPLPKPGPDGTGSAKLSHYSTNKPCSMCGKHRTTKYFFRTNTYLCSKCEARIKHHGTVNIVNHTKALEMLNRQRTLTRIANAMKQFKVCPRCGADAMGWITDSHEQVGACGECSALVFNKDWKRFFFVYNTVHPNQHVTECVYEFKGATLLGIYPINHNPYVRVCDTCGSYTAQFITNHVNDVEVITCHDCHILETY